MWATSRRPSATCARRSTIASSTRSRGCRSRRSNGSPCGCGTACITACRVSPRSRSRAIHAMKAASIAGRIPGLRRSKAMARKITGLKQLGAKTPLPKSPAEATLERVPNPHPDTPYIARFTGPEFTCLCPVTGQPDFAHFVIDYAPRAWLLESKSLKLYLASFRNVGAFHEDATIAVGKRVVELIDPAWLRIGGYWYPRGGIPIDVFWQFGAPPDGVWIPEQGVAPYRGRG